MCFVVPPIDTRSTMGVRLPMDPLTFLVQVHASIKVICSSRLSLCKRLMAVRIDALNSQRLPQSLCVDLLAVQQSCLRRMWLQCGTCGLIQYLH